MEVEFIEQGHIYLVDGIITPSVSEILRFIFPDKYKNVPPRVLEEKALFGTHIHEAIEAYEKGDEPILTDMERVTFSQYLKVKEEHQIKPLEMEEIVHYEDRYAGRLDMIAFVDGEVSMIDFKTTSKLDIESLEWQLGMYQLAKEKKYKKCYCLWLPKKDLGQLVEIDPKNKDDILEVLDRYEKQKGKIVCYF
nr:MAG TPA: PD-(D/E)XK nuclease superfamily protein [Caudoviricetes sp.]